MKNCPHCGGEIQDAAIKCKHCRSTLSDQPPGSTTDWVAELKRDADAYQQRELDEAPIEETPRPKFSTGTIGIIWTAALAVAAFMVWDQLPHGTESAKLATCNVQNSTIADKNIYLTTLVRKREKSVEAGTTEWKAIDDEMRQHQLPPNSDSQVLSKLLVGEWDSPRHEYLYRNDGTWTMLPIEPGITNGHWRIEGNQIVEYAGDAPTAESPVSRSTIILLTDKDLVFVDGTCVFYETRGSEQVPASANPSGNFKNLQTSLEGGPDSDTMDNLIRQWIGPKFHKLKRIKIDNEYTRNIDGETVYFYDIDAEGEQMYAGVTVSKIMQCYFVKRGHKWYLYDANGQ